MARGAVQCLGLVGTVGQGVLVVDQAVDFLGFPFAEHLLLVLLDVGQEGGVSQLEARAVGKFHGLDKPVDGEIGVLVVPGGKLLHRFKHVERHGAAAGGLGGEDFEAAVVDAEGLLYDQFVVLEVVHRHGAVCCLDEINHGLG